MDLLSLVSSSMHPFLCSPSMPSVFYAPLSLCKPFLYAPLSLCSPLSMQTLSLYANPLSMQTHPLCKPTPYAPLSLCSPFSMHSFIACLLIYLHLLYALALSMRTHPLCELPPMRTHPLCKPTLYASLSPLCFSFLCFPLLSYANPPPMRTHPYANSPLCKLTPYANSPHMQTHPICKLTPLCLPLSHSHLLAPIYIACSHLSLISLYLCSSL